MVSRPHPGIVPSPSPASTPPFHDCPRGDRGRSMADLRLRHRVSSDAVMLQPVQYDPTVVTEWDPLRGVRLRPTQVHGRWLVGDCSPALHTTTSAGRGLFRRRSAARSLPIPRGVHRGRRIVSACRLETRFWRSGARRTVSNPDKVSGNPNRGTEHSCRTSQPRAFPGSCRPYGTKMGPRPRVAEPGLRV